MATAAVSHMKTYYCHLCQFEFKSCLALNCCVCSGDCIEELSSDLLIDGVSFTESTQRQRQSDESLSGDMWLSQLLDSISLNSITQNTVQSESSNVPQTRELFCHVCDLQFGSSEANPICPMCNSGFVVEVSDLLNENDVYNDEEDASSFIFDDIPEEVLAFLRADSEITQSPPSEQCPICMEDCVQQDDNVQRLSCSHLFHQDCINTWLQRTRKCPVCRRRV